jgi:hypothetical protein
MGYRPRLAESDSGRIPGGPLGLCGTATHRTVGSCVETPRQERRCPERSQRPLAVVAGRHYFSCDRIGDIDGGAWEVQKRDASSCLAVGVVWSAAVAAPRGVRVVRAGGGADTDANIHGVPNLDPHEHCHSFTYAFAHQHSDAYCGAHTYATRPPAGGCNPPRAVAILAGGPGLGGERRIIDPHPCLCR